MSRGVDIRGRLWTACVAIGTFAGCASAPPAPPPSRPAEEVESPPPMAIGAPDTDPDDLLPPPADPDEDGPPGAPPRAPHRRAQPSGTGAAATDGPRTRLHLFGLDEGAVAVRVNGTPAAVGADGRWEVEIDVGRDHRVIVETTDAEGETRTRTWTADGR